MKFTSAGLNESRTVVNVGVDFHLRINSSGAKTLLFKLLQATRGSLIIKLVFKGKSHTKLLIY